MNPREAFVSTAGTDPGDRPHILLVDDDPVLRAVLRETLTNRDYTVSEAESAQQVREDLDDHPWDLIVLDRRLPDCDGLVLMRALRERSDCPVFILSVLGDEHDRVLGLELGAADYLAKPVNLDELCIRIRNALSHRRPSREPIWRHTLFGDFKLDSSTRMLTRGATEWRLTAAETRILEYLVIRAGEVVDRNELTHKVFHRAWHPNDRSVDVLVARLRKIIEDNPRRPRWIVTLHGEGYRFCDLS